MLPTEPVDLYPLPPPLLPGTVPAVSVAHHVSPAPQETLAVQVAPASVTVAAGEAAPRTACAPLPATARMRNECAPPASPDSVAASVVAPPEEVSAGASARQLAPPSPLASHPVMPASAGFVQESVTRLPASAAAVGWGARAGRTATANESRSVSVAAVSMSSSATVQVQVPAGPERVGAPESVRVAASSDTPAGRAGARL